MVRYDTRLDFGGPQPETRREYNQRFGQPPGPEPDVPDAASHVWDWFWQLNGRRFSNDGGPQPVTYTEIQSWREAMRVLVTPEEIRMLLAMDDAYRAKSGEELRARREAHRNKPPPPKPKR